MSKPQSITEKTFSNVRDSIRALLVRVRVLESGGAGTGDMTKAVYDSDDDGKVNSADSADTASAVPYAGITGLPATFPPDAHTHDDRYYTEGEVDTALAGKSDTGHTHDDRYYTEAEVNALIAAIPLGWKFVRNTVQQDIGATVAWQDITGLNFPVVNGGSYAFRARVPYKVSASAEGARFGTNSPATSFRMIESIKQVVDIRTTGSTDAMSHAILTANDTAVPLSVSEPLTNTNLLWQCEGTFIASADGTFTLRASKESTSNILSILPTAWLEWRQL